MNSSTKTLRIHRFNNGWIFLSGFLLLQLATTNNSFFVSAALRGSAIADDWKTKNIEADSNSFTLPSGSGGAQGVTPPSDSIAGNSESAAAVGVGGIADDRDRALYGPDYYGRKAGKSGKYNYSYFYYYPKAGKSGKSGKYNNSYFYYYPKAGKSGKYRNYDYSDDYYYQSGSKSGKSGKSGKYYYSDDYYYPKYGKSGKSGKSGKYNDFYDYYYPTAGKSGKSGRAGKSTYYYYSDDYY